MVRNCCVPQCNSELKVENDLKCHLFPKDKMLKNKWLHALRLGRSPSVNMVVCGRHFKESDYMARGQGISKRAVWLKKENVPSLCLPKTKLELSEILTTKRKRKSPLVRDFPIKKIRIMAPLEVTANNELSEQIEIQLPEQFETEVATTILCGSELAASVETKPDEQMEVEGPEQLSSYDSGSTFPSESIETAQIAATFESDEQFELDVSTIIMYAKELAASVERNPGVVQNEISSNDYESTLPYLTIQKANEPTNKVSTGTQTLNVKPVVKSIGVMVTPDTKSTSTQTTFSKKRVDYNFLSDNELSYLTGLDRKRFEVICALVEKFNPIIPRANFTKKELMLIALFKIRHNLDYKMIDFMFHINRNGVSDIFKDCVDKLYSVLKQINIWEVSYKNRKLYRCILDCTECFVARLEDPNIHQLTFSTYKGRPTFKVLVSCDEKGAVNFISDAFPGSISDREIVEKSGLLEKLDCGDTVLADKGFDISDLLEHKGILLNIPPKLQGKTQFSQYEVLKTRIIANRPILIENINCRAKKT